MQNIDIVMVVVFAIFIIAYPAVLDFLTIHMSVVHMYIYYGFLFAVYVCIWAYDAFKPEQKEHTDE